MPKASYSVKKKAAACLAQGRLHEAKQLYDELARKNKNDGETWFMLGAINGQLGFFQESLSCCRKAVALKPDDAQAHYNLALVHTHMEKYSEAAAAYQRVVELNPEHADAHNNLGYALEKSGQYDEAAAAYRRAVEVKPDFAEAYTNLGNLLFNLSQIDAALPYLKLAVKLKPASTKALLYLGLALQNDAEASAAHACFDRALSIEPGNTEIIAAKAIAYEKSGAFAEAHDLLRDFVAAGTQDPHLARAYGALCRHVDDRQGGITLLERLLTRPNLTSGDKLAVHFALGKLYDESGAYDQAFFHYQNGNSLKQVVYDPLAIERTFADIKNHLHAATLPHLPHARNTSELPVFVVGMPRSGTTLVEQILASHSQILGAGELVDIEEIARALPRRVSSAKSYVQCLEEVKTEHLDDLAEAQLRHLRTIGAEAERVVDKMPHNFLYLGLIELLFPKARVIHCTRDPLDTCLSIFSYDFNARHAYATDLAWLGHYYRQYEDLMRHWESNLKIAQFTVNYETMVATPEVVIPALVDFCGLQWEEQCLRFHETKRAVKTISYDQVRRPLYKKSVARWQHYADHLTPLRTALDARPKPA